MTCRLQVSTGRPAGFADCLAASCIARTRKHEAVPLLGPVLSACRCGAPLLLKLERAGNLHIKIFHLRLPGTLRVLNEYIPPPHISLTTAQPAQGPAGAVPGSRTGSVANAVTVFMCWNGRTGLRDVQKLNVMVLLSLLLPLGAGSLDVCCDSSCCCCKLSDYGC